MVAQNSSSAAHSVPTISCWVFFHHRVVASIECGRIIRAMIMAQARLHFRHGVDPCSVGGAKR